MIIISNIVLNYLWKVFMETKIPVIEALEKIGCARNTLYKLIKGSQPLADLDI